MLSDDAKQTSIAVPIVWIIRSKTFVLSASNERHWSKDLYKIQAAIGRSWLKPTSCMTHWSKASWFSWNHTSFPLACEPSITNHNIQVNTISFPPTDDFRVSQINSIKVPWCLLWPVPISTYLNVSQKGTQHPFTSCPYQISMYRTNYQHSYRDARR